MKYRVTPITTSVHVDGVSPVFGEGATHVRVDDEAGGPFIVLEQDHVELRFDLEELQTIVSVAAELIAAQPEEFQ